MVNSIWLLILIAPIFTTSTNLPLRLSVNLPLDSPSANIYISSLDNLHYPITVSYGECDPSTSQHEAHHTISTVTSEAYDRLVWILPSDIPTRGCVSAWSTQHELLGRSERLEVNKYSRSWLKKQELDQGKRLSKRVSIPMGNVSGIDAQGPWFDGVEVLKEKEIGAVSVQEAKAKSMCVQSQVLVKYGRDTDVIYVEIAIVGAGMAGLMTWVSDSLLRRQLQRASYS